jgi:hypothetical protein
LDAIVIHYPRRRVGRGISARGFCLALAVVTRVCRVIPNAKAAAADPHPMETHGVGTVQLWQARTGLGIGRPLNLSFELWMPPRADAQEECARHVGQPASGPWHRYDAAIARFPPAGLAFSMVPDNDAPARRANSRRRHKGKFSVNMHAIGSRRDKGC